MGLPTDRNSLVRFCLGKLGAPVVRVNVDEIQIENLVDETLELYREYHVNGTSRHFAAVRVTASTLKLLAAPGIEFQYHEQFVGGTSGAVGRVEGFDTTTNSIIFTFVQRNDPTPFEDGEIVTGSITGASGTTAANSLTFGMMDNKYVDLDEKVIGIIDVMKVRSTFGSHPINPFDLQYQLAQQVTVQTFLNADVVTYYMFQQDISLWDQLFVGKQPYWHARTEGRLYLDVAWTEFFRVGDYFAFQFWSAVDPEEFNLVYSDRWIRKYLTAALGEQWGINLGKFENVALPGGIVLNGGKIEERGRVDKEKALEELKSTYEPRVGFRIG